VNIACQTINTKTKKRICPSVTCNPSIRETIRSGGKEIDETLAIAKEAKTTKMSNIFKMYLKKYRLFGIMSSAENVAQGLLGSMGFWFQRGLSVSFGMDPSGRVLSVTPRVA
jgi:hypothetical protein